MITTTLMHTDCTDIMSFESGQCELLIEDGDFWVEFHGYKCKIAVLGTCEPQIAILPPKFLEVSDFDYSAMFEISAKIVEIFESGIAVNFNGIDQNGNVQLCNIIDNELYY